MKDFFVADAPRFENQSITSYFSLSSLSLRDRKGGGGQYLALTLTDKTGQLEGAHVGGVRERRRDAARRAATSRCRG